MVVSKKFIEENYPLHYLVWQNRPADLESLLNNSQDGLKSEIEKLDPRGRSPLFLAVTLSANEAALILLKHNADTSFEHSSGWTVVHEAVCSGNPELLGLLLKYRDVQRRAKRSELIPKLLSRLKDAPDFYVEMKWEFTSWVPLVTRMCPANTHRVYKMGSYLRVDSSDTGFDHQSWPQGSVSVIFQGKDDCVKMMDVDHSSSQVFTNIILSCEDKSTVVPDGPAYYEKTISQRLSNPAIISNINLEKIAFERNKTGIWGWGSDKSEKINNYECKVFAATNVELVTKMRYEHLAEADKSRKTSMSHLQKILSTFGSEETDPAQTQSPPTSTSTPLQQQQQQETPPPTYASLSQGSSASAGGAGAGAVGGTEPKRTISLEEYFDKDLDLNGADIGQPQEVKTKVNKFKATVWLSEEYPLNLQEQLMPIVDIMALSSSQFSKLKDFIQMQIPSGFPLKIEIPLFHLVNACITFHNIFGTEEPATGVSQIEEESGRLSCVLEEELFEPPAHYLVRKGTSFGPMNSSDEDLFQWTNDESPEKMDIYQALNAPRSLISKDQSPDSDAEEQLLQRAIEESLRCAYADRNRDRDLLDVDEVGLGGVGMVGAGLPSSGPGTATGTGVRPGPGPGAGGLLRTDSMEQLQMVLELSRKEIEDEARLRRDEEEALNKVLQLSLTEK